MSSKQIDVKQVNFEEFDKMMDKIAEYISSLEADFDFIVGIPRGGLIPGAVLSHRLNIPYMELSDYLNKPFGYANICLVDEVADSGKTLKRYLRYFDLKKTKVITLHYKPQSIVIPDYFVEKVDNNIWISYWWEKSKYESR